MTPYDYAATHEINKSEVPKMDETQTETQAPETKTQEPEVKNEGAENSESLVKADGTLRKLTWHETVTPEMFNHLVDKINELSHSKSSLKGVQS